MKTNITNAIGSLTSALVKLGTDDKAALGDLSLAKLSIEKACCALNNTIHPEGTSGYIPLNAEGLPQAEEPDFNASENTASDDADKETGLEDYAPTRPISATKSPLQRELDFLAENLPNFSATDLESSYWNNGIPGAVKYLLSLAGARFYNSDSVTLTTSSVGETKLAFSIANGELTDTYSSVIRDHLVTLLGFVGYDLVNCDISHGSDYTTFTFNISRKSAPKTNCYVISPLLFAAGRLLGFI